MNARFCYAVVVLCIKPYIETLVLALPSINIQHRGLLGILVGVRICDLCIVYPSKV